MTNIKCVYFDIDGTLIPIGEDKMPESTYDSLLKLKEKGIPIVIATGKSLSRISKIDVMRVPFDGFLTLNGQLCYDEDFKMRYGIPIPDNEMVVLQRMFENDKIPFIFIGEFSRYANYMSKEMIQNLLNTNDDIPNIGKYHGEKIYQITACVNEKQRKMLEGIFEDCKITSWSEDAIDIINKNGGKMNAIKAIINALQSDPKNIMAFGDSENDIEMLKYAGIGVAMGNATDECKKAANYVTTDIHDDGIKNALIHFGLID